MKQKIKKVSIWILTLMLAVVFIFPSQTFAAGGNPKAQAKDVQYFTKDGKKTGIKSIKIDSFNYANLSQSEAVNPDGKSTITLSQDVLRNFAQKQLFPAWAPIAEAVFAEQADQFVSIYADNMMSKDLRNKDSF